MNSLIKNNKEIISQKKGKNTQVVRQTFYSSGITLIVLIITIIVLLILSLVVISVIQGNGILNYAKKAKSQYSGTQVNESETLQQYEKYINLAIENYKPVEYIQTTGTQWIDTGVNSFNKTTEVTFMANDTNFNVLIGGTYNGDSHYNVTIHGARYYFGTMQSGSEPAIGTADTDKIHTVKYNNKNGALIVDGQVLSSTFFTPFTDEIIYIGHKVFKSEYSKTKFYSVKIYDKETEILEKDFIPVLDTKGTPCMYDKVEKKFYYNQGKGTFEYGPIS